MASENVVPPTNPDLEDLVFWLDEVKLDENSEEGPQVSLEILLGKLCNHMAQNGVITAEARYGHFGD